MKLAILVILNVAYYVWALLFVVYIFQRYLLMPMDTWKTSIQDFTVNRVATWSIGIHWTAAILVMLLGNIQLFGFVRRMNISLHRWNGRVYSFMGIITSIGGLLYIALRGCSGGISMILCFSLYGSTYLASILLTIYFARTKNIVQHREWAIRAYTLGIGSLLYRLYILPLRLSITDDLPIEYAWLWLNIAGWVMFLPNILIAEPYIWYTRKPRKSKLKSSVSSQALLQEE